MVIIDPKSFNDFDEYIESLSKKARKNYAYVVKHNPDLVYCQVEFNREKIERFMRLWQEQLIRGKPIEWAYGIGYVEDLAARGELLVFEANESNETIAMHFIQERNGFWECGPPMYSKKYNNRYLAKFMWFNLIRYAISNKLDILDMGGGSDEWRDMLKNRIKYPNPAYKFIYVPEDVKDNPDKQPDYVIKKVEDKRILYERI